MFPTLPATAGTAVIKPVNRFGRGIKIGDVIVAKHPWYVGEGVGKRVLGMPGDYVILDPPSSAVANVDEGPTKGMMVQVPEGHCWLGGDNLPYSRDSRHYGPVPLGLIQGKVIGVWRWTFPWGSWTPVKNTLEPVEWEEEATPGELVMRLQDKEKDAFGREAQEKKG